VHLNTSNYLLTVWHIIEISDVIATAAKARSPVWQVERRDSEIPRHRGKSTLQGYRGVRHPRVQFDGANGIRESHHIAPILKNQHAGMGFVVNRKRRL
jgi:hypothetical protein